MLINTLTNSLYKIKKHHYNKDNCVKIILFCEIFSLDLLN
jgi:hypothetical protein